MPDVLRFIKILQCTGKNMDDYHFWGDLEWEAFFRTEGTRLIRECRNETLWIELGRQQPASSRNETRGD